LALLVLVVAVVLLHLFVNRRWGYHSDELYFIECGRHLAFGYVDHAPMVPWLAGLVCPSGECSLFALRFPSLVARALAVLLTGKLVWELGGGRFATVLAGLAVIIAPALQRMGKILCIPVLEPVLWTACAIVVVYLIQGRSRRWWLALGVLAGIGLLTKHTMLIWGFAALVGIVLTPLRRDLRTRWPWLAGLIAVLIFLPHLIWQAQNGWATLEFLRNISDGMLANIPRPLFVLGQLLYMHPVAIPLWVAGLVFFFGAAGARYRVLGWIFVVAFFVMLWTHAKPYYLAPAYPALFAGGAVLLEAKLRGVALRTAAAVALIVGGLLLTPFTLPILPLPQQDDALRAVLGSIVPPEALTHDLHAEYGWPEQAVAVAAVYAELPKEEQKRTVVLTARYSQASAINFFGARHGLPRAVSGHMTYYLWGPGEAAGTVIAYGFPKATLLRYFGRVVQRGRIDHPLANARERGVPIYVCRDPVQPLGDVWDDFRRYRNANPAASPPTAD
jgi:4-amino-4-deoxy-L-arabinose transferase-like glycosyltransferase